MGRVRYKRVQGRDRVEELDYSRTRLPLLTRCCAWSWTADSDDERTTLHGWRPNDGDGRTRSGLVLPLGLGVLVMRENGQAAKRMAALHSKQLHRHRGKLEQHTR